MLKIGVLVSLMHLAKARNPFVYAGFRVATWLQVYPKFNDIQQFSSIGKCSGQSPESPMNRAFHGFWQQKRAGTKPALVGRGDRISKVPSLLRNSPPDCFFQIGDLEKPAATVQILSLSKE